MCVKQSVALEQLASEIQYKPPGRELLRNPESPCAFLRPGYVTHSHTHTRLDDLMWVVHDDAFVWRSKSGKNSTSVCFLSFPAHACRCQRLYLSMSNIKTPTPSPPSSSTSSPCQPSAWYNHYMNLVCGPLLSPDGMEGENGWKTSQEDCGILSVLCCPCLLHHHCHLVHPFLYFSFSSRANITRQIALNSSGSTL